MFILNYLILTFQICFLAAPIDQKGKEYQNETSINQLKQNPEINNLDSTSKSSTNDNNIFSYIQTFFEKIISFVFSKICNTTNFIINPIKNLFIDSKTQKNEEPEIQEKKSLTNIQVSIENRTQEKPVNSVNPSSADPSNPQTNQVLSTDKTLLCRKSKISQENNAEGLEIDFSILDLKFGADITGVNQRNDEAKKFKTLLDFAMASIAKNYIDEFRLIMDLNDQKIFVVPYSTTNSANKRQEYVSGGDSLTIKLQNLLANRSSTFEFLYYINQNSDADEIWMGGVWSRGPRSNKISKNDPALKMIVTAFDKNTRLKNNIDVKSTDSNDFKKDIMEMWSNWNDGQKYNYCYGILKALHSMGIKKSPGLYLKWNRGRKSGTQSQELNHVHVILEEKEDLEKMNLLLYEYRNKLEEEKFLPQKWLSSLNTNSLFSANEKDFI